MKNKGFTLVEILGVMTLLSIIFAIVYPNVINMLNGGKERDYAEYKDNICLAAEAYANSNIIDPSTGVSAFDVFAFNSGELVEIEFSKLMASGFLASTVVDPSTGKTVSNLASNKVSVKLAPDKSIICSIVSGG